MKNSSVGYAIPAYADPSSLRRCLGSIFSVTSGIGGVTVTDDSGTGRIASELRDTFPQVDWVENKQNLGFGPSANLAVRENRSDIVVLLNDDVELLSDPNPVLRSAFEDDAVFAVSFRSVDETGRFREGAKRLVWNFGYPKVLHNERDQLPKRDGILPTSYAVGGHAAFRRDRFIDLGGFDPLFAPFYWEDVDLSFRASKRGWKSQYDPRCVVAHCHGGAIQSTHHQEVIREMTQRNRLLFAWRHGSAWQNRVFHLALVWETLRAKVIGDRVLLQGYESARLRWQEYLTAASLVPPERTREVSID